MSGAQDKAYAYIKERIINLEIAPGEPLRAQELAKQLRTSRTPVRETLSRLEQEGLVVRTGGWGYVASPISLAEILDLFNVREALEVRAALEALPRADTRLITALKQQLMLAKRSLKAKRYSQFRRTNLRFRLLIADAAGNALLKKLLQMINDRIRLVGALHLDLRKERAAEALAENTAILEALKKKDPDALETAVLAHIRNSRDSVVQSAARRSGGHLAVSGPGKRAKQRSR